MLSKIRAWVKLTSVNGISSARAIKIVHELGDPSAWIDQKDTPITDFTFVSEQTISSLVALDDPPSWQVIARLIEQHEIRFVTFFDAEYPQILKLIPDPPAWLFYLGELRQSDFIKSLAVVGTRKPSSYARVQCKKITSELAQQRLVIVSGLAYGIDAIAHRAALHSGGRTIAVMGTAVEQIYPPEHRELAEEIRHNGALISEYLPGSKANVWNFPTRNRIISGLSQGTWVVEGGKKSGSLITAKYADKQKRPVFALPADISRDTSAGSNQLIKSGAFPVMKSQDIMDVLGISVSEIAPNVDALNSLNELEKKVYQILVNQAEDLQFDKLLVLSQLKVGELSTIILSLELKGFAGKAPGNRIHPIK